MARPSVLPRRKVLLVDSCILIELIGIPLESDHQTARISEFQEHVDGGVELRIPVACVLETGRHVQTIADGRLRRKCAERFDRFIRATLAESRPWRFSSLEWDADLVSALLDGPQAGVTLVEALSQRFLEMGDMAILAEFARLHANLDPRVVDLNIWTDDEDLRGVVEHFLSA